MPIIEVTRGERQQYVEQLLCLNKILFLFTIAAVYKVRLARNCNLTAYM